MSRPVFSSLDLQVWRIVRDAEGYSSTGDVMAVLPGTHSPHVIGGALKRLSSAGHLRQRRRWNGALYGFTNRCIAPDGESSVPHENAGAIAGA
jgi:hypothetical protein